MPIIEYDLVADLLTREEWAFWEDQAVRAGGRRLENGLEVVGRWRFDWDPPKPWTEAEIAAYRPAERKEDMAFLRECTERNWLYISQKLL